jgi:hypothetical protein
MSLKDTHNHPVVGVPRWLRKRRRQGFKPPDPCTCVDCTINGPPRSYLVPSGTPCPIHKAPPRRNALIAADTALISIEQVEEMLR